MINKTESRVEALAEVKAGRISYDPAVGEFFADGERVSGAKRRTLAELRQAGMITLVGDVRSTVEVTAAGDEIGHEWGID